MSDFNRYKCLEAMRNLIDEIQDSITGAIYHYTNEKGFKGIIKTKEIWMTNALFVNDTTELRASIKGKIFKDVEFENKEFNIFKNEQKLLGDIEDYYIASFSKDSNSLYQFCLYGDYCIGFDAKKLRKNRFGLYRCVYKENDIKKWIIKQDKLKEWKDECFNKDDDGELYKSAAFFILKFAKQAKLKNKYYESEKEIRLLVVSNSSWNCYENSPEMYCNQPSIYFRDNDLFNVPVPYVKFFIPKEPKTSEELENTVKGKSQAETKEIIRKMEENQEKGPLPIKKIIIGPMKNQKEAVFATKIFLHEHGYGNVEVIPSDIPFRGK